MQRLPNTHTHVHTHTYTELLNRQYWTSGSSFLWSSRTKSIAYFLGQRNLNDLHGAAIWHVLRLARLTANALKTSQMSCQCLNVSTVAAATPSTQHPAPKRQRQRLECKIQLTCLSTSTHTHTHSRTQCSHTCAACICNKCLRGCVSASVSVCVCAWAINFMSNQAGNQATAAAANETAALQQCNS